MPGRDESFQRELAAREAAARDQAASASMQEQVRQQQMRQALENRTQTTISLRNIQPNLIRLTNDEEDLVGVQLILVDIAFNTIYQWGLSAEDAKNFHADLGDIIEGKVTQELPEDGVPHD
jgi:hypothetical protein